MNKITPLFIAAIISMSMACVSFESNAYKVIGFTAVTVDGAMNGWGDYVRAGKATQAEQGNVREAYVTYQKAMRIAASSVNSYRVTKDKSSLDAAILALSASQTGIIDLIATSSNK
jgi:hypothetical protein